MRPPTSGWQRAALWTSGLTLGGVAVIGLLHHPAAKGLLRQVGGCPIGAPLDGEARDAARLAALEAVRGTGLAPARPGPGVALGVATRDDALRWAAAAGVRCEGDADLVCRDVPAHAWGGPADAAALRLEVDAGGRVVGAVVELRGLDPDGAGAAFSAMASALDAELGSPADAVGVADGAWLAAAPLRQARRRHRFADFRAELTATHTTGGEVVVRGLYQVLQRS